VVGGVCGTYGGRVSCIQVFGGKPVRKCHLEDLILKGREVLKRIFKDRISSSMDIVLPVR